MPSVLRRLSVLIPAPIAPLLALVTALLAIYAVEFDGWSADMASYLMTRNWVLGNDFSGLMPFHYRPPLLGILLVPMTFVFGDLWGSKLLAILSVLVFAWAVYVLARVWLGRKEAGIASTVAVLSPLTFDLVTGGYGSFLSVSCGLLLIERFIRAREGRRSDWWAMPVLSFLMVGINQTVPFLIGMVFVTMPKTWSMRGWGLLVASGIVASLWLPFLAVNSTRAGLFYAQQWEWWDFSYSRGWASEWLPVYVIVAGLATPALILTQRWRPYFPIVLVFLIMLGVEHPHIGLNNIMARAQIIAPVFFGLTIAPSVTWAVARFHGIGLRAVLSVGGLLIATTAVVSGHATADNLNVINHDLKQGIHWLGENANEGDIVITHPHGVGWWLGGLTGLAWAPTWPWAAPLYYESEWQDIQCVLGWRECAAEEATIASWVIVDWNLVARGFAHAHTTDVVWAYPRDRFDGTMGTLDLVWEQGGTQIYRILRPRIERTPANGRMWPWERTGEINR